MDDIEKELKKNEKLIELIGKELERDKKKFANEIRLHVGKEIVVELNSKKQNNKKSFWYKIKSLFS